MIAGETSSLADRLVGWAVRVTAGVMLLGTFVVALALFNNNYALRRLSRAEFRTRLDRSLEAATNWLATRTDVLGNPALMFMIRDMERLSGDSRLRRLLDEYRQSKFVADPRDPLHTVWRRMVDSQAPVPTIDARSVPAGDIVELLWHAHAIAPDRVLISSDQRDNMFSRTKYFWGRRSHQLLALDIYKHFNGAPPELDSTLAHLSKKVSRDEHFDLRINDSYPQRIAFILAANHPELIRSRWVERMINNQQPDGRWRYCWHSWCKGVLEFSNVDPDPTHATVQAAWALSMVKHRFPQWIDLHYR